jgi:hypothetical protein
MTEPAWQLFQRRRFSFVHVPIIAPRLQEPAGSGGAHSSDGTRHLQHAHRHHSPMSLHTVIQAASGSRKDFRNLELDVTGKSMWNRKGPRATKPPTKGIKESPSELKIREENLELALSVQGTASWAKAVQAKKVTKRTFYILSTIIPYRFGFKVDM